MAATPSGLPTASGVARSRTGVAVADRPELDRRSNDAPSTRHRRVITVAEAARRAARSPQTIRRWIRNGRLRSTNNDKRHMIEAADLEVALAEDDELPLPAEWQLMPDGRPTPNVVRAVRLSRAGH
jgi:hypothetical protein